MNSESDFRYTPFYCEENVWHLCLEPRLDGMRKVVVFISNAQRNCLLWHQKAADKPDAPVFWDYHAILLCQEGGWDVWDLDTVLGCPISAGDYIARTFDPPSAIFGQSLRFRVVPCEEYVQTFCSDRSHMRSTNGWSAPPPPWPPITPRKGRRLKEFLDMNSDRPGEVLTLREFRDRYS